MRRIIKQCCYSDGSVKKKKPCVVARRVPLLPWSDRGQWHLSGSVNSLSLRYVSGPCFLNGSMGCFRSFANIWFKCYSFYCFKIGYWQRVIWLMPDEALIRGPAPGFILPLVRGERSGRGPRRGRGSGFLGALLWVSCRVRMGVGRGAMENPCRAFVVLIFPTLCKQLCLIHNIN